MKNKIKNMLCMFSAFVMSFTLLTGFSATKIEAKTKSDIKIVVKTQNKAEYKEEIKQIKKNVHKLPKSYTETCKKIYLMDENTFVKKAKTFDVERPKKIKGFVSYDKQSIYIRLKSTRTVKSYENTLVHELAHLYDFTKSDVAGEGKYTGDETFISIFQKSPNSISEYASSDIEEYFAEASRLYFQKPNKLMTKNYEVYEYLNGIYNCY